MEGCGRVEGARGHSENLKIDFCCVVGNVFSETVAGATVAGAFFSHDFAFITTTREIISNHDHK